MVERKREPIRKDRYRLIRQFQAWFADQLDIDQARKEEVYCEVLESVSLLNLSFWLQVFFSAGIATLGLVLNSPAVIIGAMLIAPLMGLILANGLSLAAGDVVLALRSLLSLTLSCMAAVGFAVLLVWLLPFNEVTAEISARTQPTLLDLMVALFSGALGSLATCQKPRGTLTSLSGVAIAVALMPPLCVVGYGLGLALNDSISDGLEIARGGGLLFLTNLVAIVFTAMLVFFAIHIDTPGTEHRVREWHQNDPESIWIQKMLERVPIVDRLKWIGGLRARFLMIGITLLAIAMPLNHALNQLRSEVLQTQQQNLRRQLVTDLWERYYATYDDGALRSYIGQVNFQEQGEQLVIRMTVITDQVYSEQEKQDYVRLIAEKLNRSPESLKLQLLEIPVATRKLQERSETDIASGQFATPSPEPEASILELRQELWQKVSQALANLNLPGPAKLLSYELRTNNQAAMIVHITYLSSRAISPDAQALLTQDVQRRLAIPEARVALQWIETNPKPLAFELDQAALTPAVRQQLQATGEALQAFPSLQAEFTLTRDRLEPEGITQQRSQQLQQYLKQGWSIADDQLSFKAGATAEQPTATIRIRTVPSQGNQPTTP